MGKGFVTPEMYAGRVSAHGQMEQAMQIFYAQSDIIRQQAELPNL